MAQREGLGVTPQARLTVTYLSVAAIGIPAYVSPPPFLIWNASASVPIGLYMLVLWDSPIVVGDMVIARPPEPLASYLDRRRSLPKAVLLVKPVAATAGQKVCREGVGITIDGNPVARAQLQDRSGRTLPTWSGCRILGKSDVFLMNAARPDSLDSRYFGPVSTSVIVGRVATLWTPKTVKPWP